MPPYLRFPIGALIGCAMCYAGPNGATQLPQSFEAIAKKQFGAGSLTEEIIAGCTKYREATGRWAKSKEERKKDNFKTFSLGMKQRLAIASSLLNNPEVLILDEPTNGLDPEGIIQIREIIGTIAKQGITIIIASHLLDEIEKICSHVIVLKEGNAIYSGSVDGMTTNTGFFELKSDNNTLLLSALEELQWFTSVKIEGDIIKAQIRDDASISASGLNQKLSEKGIFLSHLAKKKQSLETQFLELVKNNH